jgi:hypothetical protein
MGIGPDTGILTLMGTTPGGRLLTMTLTMTPTMILMTILMTLHPLTRMATVATPIRRRPTALQ